MKHGPILCLLLTLVLPAFAEPSLEVSPSRESLYIGESLILEVKVGGSAQPPPPDVSRITDARVELLGSQNISHQSIVIVNNQMRREGFTGRSFHFRVTPTREGRIRLGPITASIDGQTLSQPGPAVQVTGIEKQDVVSISVTPSRDAVLVDEPFEIRLAVRLRRLDGAFEQADPLFPADPPHLDLPFVTAEPVDGLEGPDIQRLLNERLAAREQPSFTINDYSIQPDFLDFSAMLSQQRLPARFKLDRQPVDNNGIPCWEYSLTLRYTALAEATHTFGPVLFKGNVPVTVRENGSAEGRAVFAVGPAAIVRVIPPPEADRPDSYVGAIGSGLTVDAALDAQTCNVGDPLTLSLSISGPVQIRNVSAPKLSLQENLVSLFEVYDDTVKTSRKDGTLTCQYTLRPRQAGSIELPPLEVAFYDISSRRYRVVTTRPVPIKVRQSTEITASQVIGGTTNAAGSARQAMLQEMTPAGIRMGRAGAQTAPLVKAGGVWLALVAAGPALFTLTLAGRLLYRRRERIVAACRRRRALSTATKSLVAAARSPVDFDARACRAFRLYLEMRLHVPAASMTPGDARQCLLRHHVPEDTAAAFASLLQSHFDRAFHAASPAVGKPDPAPSIRALEAVERALGKTARQPPRGPHLSIPCLALALAAAAPAHAEDPNRAFLWDEANAAMSSARQPGDFLEAAAIYQKLVDSGARHGDLFFNQGTAFLLAEKYEDAANALLRAERYDGARKDISRNLAIARGRAAGLKTPLTPWSRIVLFWHYAPPCPTRAYLAAAAFLAAWLLATLLLVGWRRTVLPLFWIATLVCVLAASSLVTTLIQENLARRPASLRTFPTATP